MATMTFTDGDDLYEVTAPGSYELSFLGGNDILTLRHPEATTVATMGEGADVVSHRAGAATVGGGAGSDRFEVYASGLIADAGDDDDLLNIRGGVGLSLSGGLGSDRFNFYANSTSVLLHGNDGDDDFLGYGRTISGDIHGDAGNDYFLGFVAGANLRGGQGNDVYRATVGSAAAFLESPGEGTDTIQVARGSSLTLPGNIENISVQGFSGSDIGSATLTGNASANTIVAHNNADTISGLGGNDRLSGKGGNDTLYGGIGNDYLDGGGFGDVLIGEAGDDVLQGRSGEDNMQGGDGDDTYYVDTPLDVVTEIADAGIDTVRLSSFDLYTLPEHVERGIITGSAGMSLLGNYLANDLTGGQYGDTLNGADGDDALRGGGGNDELFGGFNADVLAGGAGDDQLWGDSHSDTLLGGDGNDWLSGGTGADTLTGGLGHDIFKFFVVPESSTAAYDVITDFTGGAGTSDVIDLSAVDADSTTVGNQAFSWNFTGVAKGVAGDLWYTSTPDGSGGYFGIFYGDVNGDGVADLEFHVHLLTALALDDVVL